MDKLIEALQIFRKYGNPPCPTHCEHDVLYVMIQPELVSAEDIAALKALGFEVDKDSGCNFRSSRFGSA